MKQTIFYSWQSDLPNATNRGFIEKCLEQAISELHAEGTLEVEPCIDRDTVGVPGSPDIVHAIFEKIDCAAMFVCDVSFINCARELDRSDICNCTRPTLNPNVAIELGRAMKSPGIERVACVFNEATGNIADLPFDLRNRRIITYRLQKGEEKAEQRKSLVCKLKLAVQEVMKTATAAVAESSDERFSLEMKGIEQSWQIEVPELISQGGWTLTIRPTIYDESRFTDRQQMEQLIQRRAIRNPSTFPRYYDGAHPQEWGIAYDRFGGVWAMTFSGMFMWRGEFSENAATWKSNRLDNEDVLAAGKWLAFQYQIENVVKYFTFLTRYASEFKPDSEIAYELKATGLKGRCLVSTDFRVDVAFGSEHTESCRVPSYLHSNRITVEALQATWPQSAASTLRGLFNLFPNTHISVETLTNWVTKYARP